MPNVTGVSDVREAAIRILQHPPALGERIDSIIFSARWETRSCFGLSPEELAQLPDTAKVNASCILPSPDATDNRHQGYLHRASAAFVRRGWYVSWLPPSLSRENNPKFCRGMA